METEGGDWEVFFTDHGGWFDLHGVGRELPFVYRFHTRQRDLDGASRRKICSFTRLRRRSAVLLRSTRKGARDPAGPKAGNIGDKHSGEWLHGFACGCGKGFVRQDEDALVSN